VSSRPPPSTRWDNQTSDADVLAMMPDDDGPVSSGNNVTDAVLGAETGPESGEFTEEDALAMLPGGEVEGEGGEPAATETEPGEAETDFDAMAEEMSAKSAVLALREAGLPDSTLRALWTSDKPGLVALAKKLAANAEGKAQPESKPQGPQTLEAELDAAMKDSVSGLNELFDEETGKAVTAPVRAAAKALEARLTKTITPHLQSLRSDFGDIQERLWQLDTMLSAQQLAKDFPALADAKEYGPGSRVYKEMEGRSGQKDAKGQPKYTSVSALMKDSAQAVYATETKQQRQKANFEAHKSRSNGMPGPTRQSPSGVGGPRDMSREQWQRIAFTLMDERGWTSERITAFKESNKIRIVEPKRKS
jgi:hypothetical protein